MPKIVLNLSQEEDEGIPESVEVLKLVISNNEEERMDPFAS